MTRATVGGVIRWTHETDLADQKAAKGDLWADWTGPRRKPAEPKVEVTIVGQNAPGRVHTDEDVVDLFKENQPDGK